MGLAALTDGGSTVEAETVEQETMADAEVAAAASSVENSVTSTTTMTVNPDSLLPETSDASATFGNASSTDYRTTFFEANPQLEGQVVVHHAVEQQVLKKFPGVVTESEIHSIENLRGIPMTVNSDLHLSQIRIEWNKFYKPFRMSGTTPTKAQLLQKASEIDAQFGSGFMPTVGGAK